MTLKIRPNAIEQDHGPFTFPGIILPDGATIGQAAGPLITFDDTNNYLEITGCRVGIGTDAPDQLLHLSANTGATIRIESTDTAIQVGEEYGAIEFETRDNSAPGVGARIVAVASGVAARVELAFETGVGGAATEKMRIDYVGKVGIGIAAPDTILHIYSSQAAVKIQPSGNGQEVSISLYRTTGGGVQIASGTIESVGGSEAGLLISTTDAGSSPFITIEAIGHVLLQASSGNVAIGLVAPSAKLHIDQPSTTAAIPVLTLDQADISEEFIKFIGAAAAGVLTQSIVDEGDQASEAREGWLKVEVEDVGDQIADQAYYVPIYSLAA